MTSFKALPVTLCEAMELVLCEGIAHGELGTAVQSLCDVLCDDTYPSSF